MANPGVGLIAMALGALVIYEGAKHIALPTSASAAAADTSAAIPPDTFPVPGAIIGPGSPLVPSVPAAGGNNAQVGNWIQQAMAAEGVTGQDWANGLYTIAYGETGGTFDPHATSAGNPNDPNTAHGTPTIGLTQQLPDSYPGGTPSRFGLNLLNPVQNIMAAIKYIRQTYGSITAVPGVQTVAAYRNPAQQPSCPRGGSPNFVSGLGGWYCPY